ncbi:LRR receptor serine/threonine-protein kinase EFR [Trifolium repens]|nr:LRR receptor serine/threonine-protein kinase EFR [Trifolium repens]
MVNLLSSLSLVLLSSCFMACLGVKSNRKNITTDEFSLLAFKSLITSNSLSNNWSTSTFVCSWIGITCDEQHGRVHTLNISSMGVRGTISPNLGNLSFLVILEWTNN